jgi:steroid delta-isomerase-like uncharacterized protein
MDIQRNKALHRRWFEEVFNGGRVELLPEMFAQDHVLHYPGTLGLPPGMPGVRGLVALYRTGFPDLALTVEDQIAERDKVTTRYLATGRHTGALGPIPASGRMVRVTGVEIARVADGKIAELWEHLDIFGVLLQIGFVTSPPPRA